MQFHGNIDAHFGIAPWHNFTQFEKRGSVYFEHLAIHETVILNFLLLWGFLPSIYRTYLGWSCCLLGCLLALAFSLATLREERTGGQ